ncbi:hypothetical protein H7H78_02230 [Mycobacterium shinjukuense]|uniref:Type ISP restriction-modification enzyme LLaBIII C-terminal specificity domain-containing protein n=1 Tax=Mycobacterium shinjukuense TaxID=398694 RepID=A0A7I7MMF8_9MYCO|nr:hypothetical protein [Mycobacterium shinjukuense]BBX72683.1 hypothetical protein MSHI_05890 [Mycobacterium shinjukuense]
MRTKGAERYLLGSRSALGWIVDRDRVTSDKASGIVSDPNDCCDERDDPTYIVDLIKKVTTVSVETIKIVDSLAGCSRQQAIKESPWTPRHGWDARR